MPFLHPKDTNRLHSTRLRRHRLSLSPTAVGSVLLTALVALSIVLGGWSAEAVSPNNYPSGGPVPSDFPAGKKRFKLRQDYPGTLPAPEDAAWMHISYKDPSHSAEFLRAVCSYCFNGNINLADPENSFRVEDIGLIPGDHRRRWYHAPNMDARLPNDRGREGIHGLTDERVSLQYELASGQRHPARTYAVAFFNPVGAWGVGQVWNVDPSLPSPPRIDQVNFPKGTVCFKLLFTTALTDRTFQESPTPNSIPFLSGAPSWQCFNRVSGAVQTVQLVQVDVAVKVSDVSGGPEEPGWVFGTLQYDASVHGASPWENLTPVSLMWGEGAAPPTQTQLGGVTWLRAKNVWLNPASPWVRYRIASGKPLSALGGANGPVDDPRSSCMNCHRTGATSVRNGGKPLDYSLQLAFGVRRFIGPHVGN